MAYLQNSLFNNTVFSTGLANYNVTSTAATKYEERQDLVVPANNVTSKITNNVGKYSIFDIANWFLTKQPMTHKKLQKLCYYAQAWSYALYSERLIKADFEAWVHGPVSPVLYDRFKRFGYETITIIGTPKFPFSALDEALLEDVWTTYGEYTGNALAALSHNELPWQAARKGYGDHERCSVLISPEIMEKYYRSIQNKG